MTPQSVLICQHLVSRSILSEPAINNTSVNTCPEKDKALAKLLQLNVVCDSMKKSGALNLPEQIKTYSYVFQTPGLSRKRARASLSDISSLEDIEGLSVRQLKEILACNFVNYSGCCEKWELVEKVSRLYRESEENHKTRRFIFNSYLSFLVSSSQFCQQDNLVCNLFCFCGTTGKCGFPVGATSIE